MQPIKSLNCKLPLSLLKSCFPWNAFFNFIEKIIPHLYFDEMLQSNFVFFILRIITFQSSVMEKGYLEVQMCVPVSFNSISTRLLGHPVKLELTHFQNFPFHLFWGLPAASRKDGILLSTPYKSWRPELNTISPSRTCQPWVQGDFTACVPGSVVLPITSALGNHINLLNVAAHWHPEPVRLFHVCLCHPWAPILAPSAENVRKCACMPLCASMSAHVCLCACQRRCVYFKTPHGLLTLSSSQVILPPLFHHPTSREPLGPSFCQSSPGQSRPPCLYSGQ